MKSCPNFLKNKNSSKIFVGKSKFLALPMNFPIYLTGLIATLIIRRSTKMPIFLWAILLILTPITVKTGKQKFWTLPDSCHFPGGYHSRKTEKALFKESANVDQLMKNKTPNISLKKTIFWRSKKLIRVINHSHVLADACASHALNNKDWDTAYSQAHLFCNIKSK